MDETKKLSCSSYGIHPYKTIGVIIGLLVGLALVTLGFLKTLVVVIAVVAGYFIGDYFDRTCAAKKEK